LGFAGTGQNNTMFKSAGGVVEFSPQSQKRYKTLGRHCEGYIMHCEDTQTMSRCRYIVIKDGGHIFCLWTLLLQYKQQKRIHGYVCDHHKIVVTKFVFQE
jgi:hypothetical protein